MSNVVEFRRGTTSGHRGPHNGRGVNAGQVINLDDRRPGSPQKAKSFLDPRQVIVYHWQGTRVTLSVKVDEREIAIFEKYPQSVENVLKRVHSFYFDAAFSHMESDDPAITPFTVKEMVEWSIRGNLLNVVFEVEQPTEKPVHGICEEENSEGWQCVWAFRPLGDRG